MSGLSEQDLAIVMVLSTPTRYNGRRVLTGWQVADVHEWSNEAVQRRFDQLRDRLIAGEDYFRVTAEEAAGLDQSTWDPAANEALLFTESGYLLLTPSEDAWAQQYMLQYFRADEEVSHGASRAEVPADVPPPVPPTTGRGPMDARTAAAMAQMDRARERANRRR